MMLTMLALIITGCGSNDKTGDDSPAGSLPSTSVLGDFFSVTPSQIMMNGLNYNLLLPFEKKAEKDVKIEIDNFSFSLTGCDVNTSKFIPESIVLDGAKGSTKDLVIMGDVKQTCIPNAYKLVGDVTISAGGKSKTLSQQTLVETSLDADGNPNGSTDPNNPTVDGNYSLYNVASTIAISKAATEYAVRAQLIDKQFKAVPGKIVEILAFDSNFGSFKEMAVTTDASGWANFIYISPNTLPANGSSVPVTIVFDENGTRQDSKNMTLTFSTSSTAPNNYNFMNATSIIVKSASEQKTITVDLVDSSGVGISGQNISITNIPNEYGSFGTATATTDGAGRASFPYLAPSDLTAINNTSQNANLIYTDPSGTSITATITIFIQASSTTLVNYSLINPTTPINISYPGQKQEIAIQLVKNNTPQTGESVTAKSISSTFGNIENSTVSTGADGYARFSYVAADPLTNGSQVLEIIYVDSDGVEVNNTVTINVAKIDYSQYKISTIPSDLNVSQDGEIKTVQVYLEDNESRPAADMNVSIEYFDQKYGVMDRYDASTDVNGHIVFGYTAPAGVDILDGNTTSFRIYLQADATVSSQVNISFNKSILNSEVADIYVVPSTLTILINGEHRTVRITAVDSKNFGVNANFRIENPTKDGVDYGSFGASAFETDAQGNADINYTAPSNIEGLSDRNISIIETSTNTERILTLKFQQPNSTVKLYDLNLSVDKSINVDGSGTLGIVIHESGKSDILIDDANVIEVNATMKFPDMLRFDNDDIDITYDSHAITSYKLWAKHLSGVAIIQINATIYNGTQNVTLTQEFPVVILSGAISSMSIFHNKNAFDADTGLHEDYYTIHAVDRYGNPVSAGTALHPSLINQPKSAVQVGTGRMETPGKLIDANFSGVTDGEDRVIILPSNGKLDKYYLGDWSIKSHTNTSVSFDEIFSGTNTDDLTYIVGNEKRIIINNNIEQEALADISSPNGSYLTDDKGNVQFVVKYDPALKGEYFYVAANADSNGKRIGTALESIFFYGGYQFRSIITEININHGGGGFLAGFYMLDSVGNKFYDFNAKIDNFDDNKGGFGIDNKKDEWTYTAPYDITDLVGTTYEFNMTVSEVEGVYETIRIHFLDDTNYTNYELLTEESNFTIAQPGETHILKFYLRDNNAVLPNEIIKVEAFEPKNGTLTTYAVYTDEKGIASFVYTAPDDLSSLYGSSMTFRGYLNNNSDIDANITVEFDPVGSKDYTGYKLTAVPSDFTVSSSSEQKVYSIYLEDNDTLPVANEDVYILEFNRSTGSMDAYTKTTDANGYVSFIYTAPISVMGLDTTFKAQMKNSSIVYQQIHIGYNAKPVVDVNTTNLNLIAVPNIVSVPATGGSKILNLYLEDNVTKSPVKDINISIEFFDPNLGVMDRYIGSTDENGYVSFIYTATDAQKDDPDLNITFRVDGGVPAKETVITVKHQNSSPVVTDNMDLIAVPASVNVPNIGDSKSISLFLENNVTKSPIVGQAISADVFNPNLGRLDHYSMVTDANGFVQFTYTAPEAQLPSNDLNITFRVDGGEPLRSEVVTVSFNPNGHTDINTTNYNLIAVPDAVSVPQTGGTKKLSLYLEDNSSSTHVPVKDMDISAVFFNPNLGTLDKYVATTDANGYVSFEYIATIAQANDPDLNITFRVNGGSPDRTTIVTVKHQESQPVITDDMKLYAAPDKIAVSSVDSSKTIEVYLENNRTNTPIEGQPISAEFFNPNMGKLNRYSATTDANGYASFVYTSPANQLPSSDLNITFRVDGGEPLRTKIVTVKFQEQQPVSTVDMNLTTVPATINIPDVNSSKTFSLFLENNRTKTPIVEQSISAVVFDPNLGRLDNYAVVTDSNGFAQFAYTSPANQLPSNDLIVTFRVDGGEPLRTSSLRVTFNKNATDINTTGYELIAVPDEVNISTPSIVSTLNLYLNDTINKKPVANRVIVAQIFNQSLGTLDSYAVETDANGYVQFAYTAPATLPDQNLTIIFAVEGGDPVVEQNVSINFVDAQPLDTTDMNLTAVPDSFNIDIVGGSKVFSLFLEDNSTHTPIVGQDIFAETFDPNLGRLSSYSVKTDSNGFAQFTYKAPADKSPANAISMKFKVTGGVPTRDANVEVTFTQTSDDVNTTDYNLTAVPESISIPNAGGSKTFSLFLENNATHTPVANQNISAETFNPNLGRLDKYVAKTDANGFVQFTYTATDAQSGQPDLNITFKLTNGNPNTLDTNVTVKHLDAVSSEVNTTEMNITAVPASFNIDATGISRTFSIFLENNVTHSPIAGQSISAETFDPNLGRLSSYSVKTDTSGFAQFTYIASEIQLPTADLNLTFKVESGTPQRSTLVNITFTQNSDKVDTSEYNLTAVPEEISVPNTGGSRTFYLFLENNLSKTPVPNRVITAEVFDPNLGRLDSYSATTDSSGFAAFTYSSTNEQSGIADFNITFKIQNGDPTTLDTQVKVVHAASASIVTDGMTLTPVPSGASVPKLGGSASFSLFLEKDDTPVEGSVIQAVTFNPNLGRLDKYIATTDASGFVSFVYTATIAQRDDPDFNITFKVMNGNPTLDTNVTIYHQAMPEVNSTNFKLHPVPPTINVFKGGITHAIDMYLEDINKSAPIAGQAISAKFFNPNDGTLSAYTVITDENGFASFTYKAPEAMPLSYHTLPITFYVAGGTTEVNTTVDVKFQPQPDVNSTNYELMAVPANLGVPDANTSSPIDIYLRDTNRSMPVEGQTISADFFDPRSGTLDRYSAVTDANGHAVFAYSSPTPLPSSDLNISFKVEGATIERRADVNVSFASLSQEQNTTDLVMTIVDDNISITEPATTKNIKIKVDDGTNPKADIPLVAHVFNPKLGTLDRYRATTDAKGEATFVYTSGSTFTLGDLNITFAVEGGAPALEANASIHFVQWISVDTSHYVIYTIPSEVNATNATRSPLELYVFEDVNWQPVIGLDIDALGFDPKYGELDRYTGKTDDNGHIVFEHTAPDTLPDTNTSIVFRVKGGVPTKEANITINFVEIATTVDTSDMNLTLLQKEINVSITNKEFDIDIYLAENDAPAIGREIIVEFFNPADGTMDRYSAEIDDVGHAAFKYQSPDKLPTDHNLTVRFFVKNGNPVLDENLSINFEDKKYVIYPDENITVTNIAQSHEINVSLAMIDENNVSTPAEGKMIVAEFLMPIYGNIGVYKSMVRSDGGATFTYTSPSRIADINDTNITFYFEEDKKVIGRTKLLFRTQQISTVEHLYIAPSAITITTENEEKTITIITTNSDNVGVKASIQIEEPYDGNDDYGSFTPSGKLETDDTGKLVVVYKAPSSVSGISERNITVTEMSKGLTQELNINYNKATGLGIDYEITATTKPSLEVDTEEYITIVIHERGNKDATIPDGQVYEVNLTSRFANMLTFDGNTTAAYDSYATQSVALNTGTLSGSAIIEISANIDNGEQNVTITKLVPVVIQSGPVASMSLVYSGSQLNGETGLYENMYTIHAVDKYNNPANEGITLHPSIINGLKVIGDDGKISIDSPTKLESVGKFGSVNSDDLVAIVPNSLRTDPIYLGNWSVVTKVDANELTLAEVYDGAIASSLSYVIGNSNRYIDGYGIATADIKATNNNYVTDKNGNALFTVTYDPILAGHTVTISANAYDDTRTGVSSVEALRDCEGYTSTIVKIPNDGNNSDDNNNRIVNLTLSIGAGREPLAGLDIVPASIISNDSSCILDENNATNDTIKTNQNGEITVVFKTGQSSSTNTECTIQWSAQASGIYKEY